MFSRLFVRSEERKLGRRMGRKKRSHKDDCASTKRCNILSAPGNVDSTRRTDPRAKPVPICACTNTFLYYFHISGITHSFLHFSRMTHSLTVFQKAFLIDSTLQKLLSHYMSVIYIARNPRKRGTCK